MTQSISVVQLQAVALFADLSPTLLAKLAQHSRLTPYAPNEVVFCEGDELPNHQVLSQFFIYLQRRHILLIAFGADDPGLSPETIVDPLVNRFVGGHDP